MSRSRAAVVFTAVDRFPDGSKAGYWLPEAAYPWLALLDAGWEVVSISTDAAMPVPGGVDRSDRIQRRFLDDGQVQRQLAQTRRADFYQPDDFRALVYAGGAGALSDLPGDSALADFAAGLVAAGGTVAASGHGVAGLLQVIGPDGEPLVHGRKVTTLSKQEECLLELDAVVPYSLADELSRRGAHVSAGDPFKPYVVVDGPLVTGQNPASAPALARRLVSATAGPSSADASAG
jgi:putative intracellular protease/amidase